ncbi:hypothetical protein AB6A40_009440 [Gnathostoma spinigerum]|uniref:NAD(+) ADP-ribosyltransferase n=1 Tax=Gnathostoma spinigerum TaxID=75299 RepID=A0ABD6ESA4_9BILA
MTSEATRKQLPFAAEYAKSGRAACKGCQNLIAQGSLRMSVRKPSRFFDGLQDNWFHFNCFWKKLKKGDINEASIRGMDLLKWDDQETIREKINENQNAPDEAPSTGYKVEYSRSNRGKCAQCSKTIGQDVVKIGIKSKWYHVDCFPEKITSTEQLSHFDSLEESDRKMLSDKFNEKSSTKRKEDLPADDIVEPKKSRKQIKQENDLKKSLKKQADDIWNIRKTLQDSLSKAQMQQLLLENDFDLPKFGGESKLLDIISDCIMFGRPKKCTVCKDGEIVYSASSKTYICTGHLSAFTKCTFSNPNPPRVPFVIDSLLEVGNMKKLRTNKVRDRIYNDVAAKEEVIQPKSFSYLGVGAKASVQLYSGVKSGHAVSQGKQVHIMKNGAVVDPDCEIRDKVHVYHDEGGFWQCTLGHADSATNKNSYYKLQLLERDTSRKFYLFRSWGRVGTNIGGSKTESYGCDLEGAKQTFEEYVLKVRA